MYCLPATLRIPAHPASTPCGAVVFYRFVCHWYWHSFMLNERSNMQKLVRRSDLARSAPPWSTSGAGALATAPVPHDDDQGSQVVRNKDVAVSQSQGGGAVFMPSVFFCFRTQILTRAYRHGEEAQEAPHACRGGESGERALQLARRASGTLHNACTPFSCACTSPPPSGVDSRCGLGGAHGCSADAQRCLVRTIKFGFALTTFLLTLRALSPAFTSSALCMAQR